VINTLGATGVAVAILLQRTQIALLQFGMKLTGFFNFAIIHI